MCLPLLICPCTTKSRSSVLAPARLGGPKESRKMVVCVWAVLVSLLLKAVVSAVFQWCGVGVHLQLATHDRCSCPVCHWRRHLHWTLSPRVTVWAFQRRCQGRYNSSSDLAHCYAIYCYIHLMAFSRTSWVSQHQNLILLEKETTPVWQWHQLDCMQIICTSLQTDNRASTSPLSFCRQDALPATQPTASKHWRHTRSLNRKNES